MDLNLLRQHADECEAIAKERAQTEGGGLHYMNTCDWAYAIAFRGAADEIQRLLTVHPRDQYHEDKGPVLWWRFPIQEPPYVGSPTDETWAEHELEGFYTHWSPIPIPMQPDSATAEQK
jgi:hypothetical protein